MTELEAARRLLPEWVILSLWVVPAYLALSGYALTRLFTERGLRAMPASPWTERARCSFPLRQIVRRTRALHLAVAIVVVAATSSAWATPLPAVRVLVTLMAGYGGAHLAAIGVEARLLGVSRSAAFRSWFAMSLVMFGAAYAMFLFWALTLTSTGWPRTVLALAGFVATVLLGFGYSTSVAELLGFARPAGERVANAVERAAKRVGVRVRRVMEFDVESCNALAFPMIGRIAFTAGAATFLDDAELEAVAAHEIGHLHEPFLIRAFRPLALVLAATGVLVLPLFVTYTPENGVIIAVSLLILLLVARVVARKGERHADSYATETGAAFASALAKLSRLNQMPLVTARPGPHGHTWDRIVAAGITPDTPKPPPAPLPSFKVRFGLAFAVLLPLIASVTHRVGHRRDGALLNIAIGDSSSRALAVLARREAKQHRYDEAVTFLRAAKSLSPTNASYGFSLAINLGHGRRCDEARREYDAAIALVTEETNEDYLDVHDRAEDAVDGCR